MGVMVFKVLDLRSSEKLDSKHVFFMILIQYIYISKIFVAFHPCTLKTRPFSKRASLRKTLMRKDEILQVKVVPDVTCNREKKIMTNDSGAAGDVC